MMMAPSQEDPVAEGVRAGEGDVARADLKGHDEIEERRAHRHERQEDHRRAMHREELVVALRADQIIVRLGELGANDQRLDPTEQQEKEGCEAIQHPDAFVVDRGDPAPNAGCRLGNWLHH